MTALYSRECALVYMDLQGQKALSASIKKRHARFESVFSAGHGGGGNGSSRVKK